ncbi:hypothetical protein HHK36_014741 [Tetracentron sinense]|uniref:Uncharacterized protein n=1 Tax=Tetracentron sinense TaxID=13715 RepID=A0A834Z3A1_TETSI|nr:hypothetical protein HHK36_014741 [Tetracentron sinense]
MLGSHPLGEEMVLIYLTPSKLIREGTDKYIDMASGRSFLRVGVLNCADIIAVYTMWVLMTYLTDVWKLSITHAAAIVNVYSGLVGIMPIGMAFLLDHCLGFELVGHVNSASPFEAVGKSSHSVSKDSFREENKENYSSRIGFRHYAVIVVCVAAIISVAYIKPWYEDRATPLLEEGEGNNNRLRLLRTPGLDETNLILRIIPMWMTFIVSGIMISVGNT